MVNSLGAHSAPAEPASTVRAGRLYCDSLRLGWWLLLAGLVLPVSAQEGAAPLDGSIKIEQVEIGLEGHYKVAEWTAMRMRVTSPSAQSLTLVVEAPDSDGNPAALPGTPHDFPAGVPQTIETCFRIGRLQGELQARLVDAQGKTVAQRRWRASAGEGSELRPALRHNVPLILTLADLPEMGGDAATNPTSSILSAPGGSSAEPRLIRLPGLGSLPSSARGLESAAALILPTVRKPDGSSLLSELTPARNALLRDWVRGGGHLLVTVAAEQQAFRDSLLAAWIPVKVEGAGALRQFLDLERYSDINSPLKFTGAVKTARLGNLPQKNVLVREGNSPLIAAMPFGFGRVTVIALDIESPPFMSWPGLPAVLKKLVGGAVGAARKSSPQGNRQLTQTGVTDLATQLQLAQEDFPAIDRPSHWWVMGLLIAYLMVIGPLDYFVVTRCLKRPELTWFTFSILVCLGAGAAAWWASRINGAAVLCNQLDLVDIDISSKAIRGHSWVSLYSPENRRYAIAVEPAASGIDSRPPADDTSSKPTLTWSGVPENSVSGVYRSGGAGLGGQRYQFKTDGQAAENLPILQWSTKSLHATWTGEALQNLVEGELESGGAGMLSGAITHHLSEPLEDALFIVGGWAYFPAGENARIPPNIPWQPGGRQSRARDLKALLTGESRRKKETNDKYNVEVLTTTVPYNPLSTNRSDLVNMLSFHQVAGSGEYTGLNHAALRGLELTGLMGLGRGILIGRVKKPAARTTIDGQSASLADSQAFVRFVVPVVINERVPAATIPKREDRLPPAPPQ